MKKKIFISAGDPSGDIHAAKLMKVLNDTSDIEFVGIGGKEMEKQGLKSLVPLKDISVTGFWEVAKRYRFFKRLLKQCENILQSEDIDLFLPVDYPGFNIRLAGFAKQVNIPVVYYIAPQLWAWGKNRAKKLQGKVDKLCALFPFEKEFFDGYGLDTSFVGHPLLEVAEFKKSSFVKDKNLIALLPGSREQEVVRHLNLYSELIDLLSDYNPNLNFGIAKSSNISSDFFDEIIRRKNVTLHDDSIELMSKSYCGIVKTGTSNLEATLLEMPFTMIYKTSAITYQIGKKLINLDYISLVNILRDKAVIDELIQKDANPNAISKSIIKILEDKAHYDYIISEFKEIKKYLGEERASENTALIIKHTLGIY